MRIKPLIAVLAVAMATPAAAQFVWGMKGNDTGGIIPWSCENEAMAQQIAGAYCARWDKYHRITSVHRQYGDFIAFNCLWAPNVNPYAMPAVATRSTCAYNRPPIMIVK